MEKNYQLKLDQLQTRVQVALKDCSFFFRYLNAFSGKEGLTKYLDGFNNGKIALKRAKRDLNYFEYKGYSAFDEYLVNYMELQN